MPRRPQRSPAAACSACPAARSCSGSSGLGIGITGIAFIVMGVRRTFRNKIDIPEHGIGRSVAGLGLVGFVAKGIALIIVGILLLVAAVKTDADAAGGSRRRHARRSWRSHTDRFSSAPSASGSSRTGSSACSARATRDSERRRGGDRGHAADRSAPAEPRDRVGDRDELAVARCGDPTARPRPRPRRGRR